ncbi:MAG: RHS repeat-associated core domain-containing protein [Parachlamydiaceae bacterium]|nr:RHS repeat-associated core domain-containing protein [Parachlamydiaceae bacterium]
MLIGKAGKARYTYDENGRSIGLDYDCWNEVINSYDKAGNILSRSIKEPAKTTNCSYRYDDFYQVTHEGGVAKHSYNFDSLNNRTKKDGKKLKLNKINQLLNDSNTQYSYDLNGNLTKRASATETLSFNYDALDRLISITSKNKRTTYAYDAQNRRLSKRVDKKNKLATGWDLGKPYKFLYVGQNDVGSYDDKGNAIELRLLGLSKGAEIGAAVAVELGGKVYAPLHDHIGNVTALIDAETGKGFEFYRYTAFGEETLLNEHGEEIDSSINPWRFSSKRNDSETSFVYFGRRYYEPVTGRWITPDPLGHADGLNVYAFVHNRPLTTF